MNEFIKKAAKAYYEGNPIISDEEYDALVEGNEPLGYDSDFKHSHWYPMYSLKKAYEGDKLPFEDGIATPKLDGAAVSLYYKTAVFSQALTRGDGKKGLDITSKLRMLVPDVLSFGGSVQVVGEVVCPKTVPNARNVAAGSLNLKDLNEFKSRDLTFIAYDIFPKVELTWSREMYNLQRAGFKTVLDSSWDQFPHDGKVFRVDSNELFATMGHTAHHPRGAYALKTRQSGVVTKLLGVEWKVGKSGVVSPVGILQPVKIGEATVSRATLHNIAYIEGLDLEIGCNVEVIRSGEIIPRIVRRVR
jgi:DNA ligase (NAD+)